MELSTRFAHIHGKPPDFLASAESILARLHDLNIGEVGQRFITALNDASCVFADPSVFSAGHSQVQQSAAAVYTPFIYDPLNIEARKQRTSGSLHPFVNGIQVNNAKCSLEATVSIFHEGDHGLSWNSAAILHASGFNGERSDIPPIVLCPQDWIKMVLATEAKAFATQAWLSNLAENIEPTFKAACQANPVTPMQFQELRRKAPDLKAALIQAANIALHHKHNPAQERHRVSFGNYYAGNALDTYDLCPKLEKPEGLVFVRMQPEDLVAAGEILGMNIFDDSNFSVVKNWQKFMTPELKERLTTMNERLGIKDSSRLPAFREALAEKGLTPEKFLQISRGEGHSPIATCPIVELAVA